MNKQNDRIKTLLLYPPTGEIGIYNTPTGLLYIATVLKQKGYDVGLVDCSVEPNYRDILEKMIKDVDVLGLYAMSIHIKYLLPEVKRLKKINNKLKIIWGGPHATLFPEQTAKSSFVDIAVRGEGEEAMLEILQGYERGDLNLHNIKGISFKEGDEVITTADRDFIDMDTLPFIDWSFLKKEVMGVVKKSIIRVQTSRGCPYKCAFCINVVSKNKKMRYRSANNVLDEIEYLYNEYGAKRVGFRDEVFISSRKQVRDIAQGLLDRNIKITWLANPRVEYLRESYIDDNYLKLLVDSGCTKLSAGAESGSQRILDLLRKHIKVEDILNFTRRTKKFNITPVLAFMTSIPTETQQEQLQTLRLIRDILKIHPRAFINGPANYRPYPGGELYNMCIKNYNLKMPDSLEAWAEAEILGGAKPPWIKRHYFNQYLWSVIRPATYPGWYIRQRIKSNPLKGMAIFLLSIIAKLRLKYVFYKFPIEFKMLDWYYRFIVKKVPEFS